MNLWLNRETAQWVLDHLTIPDVGRGWDWDAVRWYVCPNCCYVEPQMNDHSCGRPLGEMNTYGAAETYARVATAKCDKVNSIPVPDALNDALWSALRIGGTNAVVEILSKTFPEDVGLPTAVEKARERRLLTLSKAGRKVGTCKPR